MFFSLLDIFMIFHRVFTYGYAIILIFLSRLFVYLSNMFYVEIVFEIKVVTIEEDLNHQATLLSHTVEQ